MKRKLLIPLLLLTNIIFLPCFGQIDKNLTYEELEEQAISSFRNNHTDSSIMIMEYLYENFPDQFGRTSIILPQMYTRVSKYSKAIKIWETGIGKGYTYNLNSETYENYYKGNVEFERIAQIEKSILDTLHLKYEISLPNGYNKDKTYPVLFIFHGNNRSIKLSKESWNSSVLSQEFITVYLQSYIPSAPARFNWVPNDEKIKNEFNAIYKQVLHDYPINTSKIIFSGMSAGGRKAIEFTLNNYFPVSGLVLNCPVIPREITDEMITEFVKKNKKLGIITGENDFALENQKNLIHKIDSLSGQAKIIVSKDLGHDFAENFSDLLDEYLKWVIN